MIQTSDYLLILIAVLLGVAVYLAQRLTNSTGTVSWTVNTTHPEPSHVEIVKLEQERDEARHEAERLRADSDGPR